MIQIRIIQRRQWPETWIRGASPGDLLLLDGKIGECGGILRLKRPGAFLVLSPEQIWRGHYVHWPFKGDRIKGCRILGNRMEFVLE